MTTDITRTGPKKSAVAVMQERFATVAQLPEGRRRTGRPGLLG